MKSFRVRGKLTTWEIENFRKKSFGMEKNDGESFMYLYLCSKFINFFHQNRISVALSVIRERQSQEENENAFLSVLQRE
jgi:hypothetical protein